MTCTSKCLSSRNVVKSLPISSDAFVMVKLPPAFSRELWAAIMRPNPMESSAFTPEKFMVTFLIPLSIDLISFGIRCCAADVTRSVPGLNVFFVGFFLVLAFFSTSVLKYPVVFLWRTMRYAWQPYSQTARASFFKISVIFLTIQVTFLIMSQAFLVMNGPAVNHGASRNNDYYPNASSCGGIYLQVTNNHRQVLKKL